MAMGIRASKSGPRLVLPAIVGLRFERCEIAVLQNSWYSEQNGSVDEVLKMQPLERKKRVLGAKRFQPL